LLYSTNISLKEPKKGDLKLKNEYIHLSTDLY